MQTRYLKTRQKSNVVLETLAQYFVWYWESKKKYTIPRLQEVCTRCCESINIIYIFHSFFDEIKRNLNVKFIYTRKKPL